MPATKSPPPKSLPAKALFGLRLRAARVEMALSQEELTDQADLHRKYIGQVERGERNISIDNMEKLAEIVSQDRWRMLQPDKRALTMARKATSQDI